MFALVSPSRQGNRYCEESARSYTFSDFRTFKADLIRSLYGWTPQKGKRVHTGMTGASKRAHKCSHGTRREFSQRMDKYNGERYRALNLHSFFYRGTVEFRHHHGTVIAAKMQGWGMVCASVLDAAMRMKVSDIEALPMGWDGLLAILSTDLQSWAITRRSEIQDKCKGEN